MVIDMAPEPAAWSTSGAGLSWLEGLLLYGCLLGILIVQRRRKAQGWTWVQLQLVLFLWFYHFVLKAHLFYFYWPACAHTLLALGALFLYFGGLEVFRRASKPSWLPLRSSGMPHVQARFLFPFALPFLLFTLGTDLLYAIPYAPLQQLLQAADTSLWGTMASLGVSLLCLAMVALFLPPLLIALWGCVPLEESPLLTDLENLCRRAHFTHGGMKRWSLMDASPTAAIVGVVPRFRYLLFTRSLLERLSHEEVVAVLSHEMGHSKHRHLLLYPFILLGALTLAFLIFSLTLPALDDLLTLSLPRNEISLWTALLSLSLFLLFSLFFGLYFRFVFGFFSRLFERQADLNVFALDIPPQDLISALDHLGALTGHSHQVPNWHHYSLQQRMAFLQKAQADPEAIARHHRRVRRALKCYFALLILSVILCLFLME